MNKQYSNIHTHIFNGKCAPDYFFKIVLPSKLDPFADEIKAFIEKKWMRRLIKLISRKRGHSMFQRYLEFLEIGTQNSQTDIFRYLKDNYNTLSNDMRFIVLTLNMDHMDTQPSYHARIEDQLAEIDKLRTYYPNNVFPFLGVDPRHKSGEELVSWIKDKFKGMKYFGLKLYPAMGYFPFDPGLDAMYQWAQDNNVPVMTHCTRSGNFYTGRMNDVIPVNNVATLNPNSPSMLTIHNKVSRFRGNEKVWKDNKHACNLFSHPENYLPILEKYPQLKLCIAHFGGEDEVLGEVCDLVKEGLDSPGNWYDAICNLMNQYPNVYTDISYTLYSEPAIKKVQGLMGGDLGARILFGTDFFMTIRERNESQLWQSYMNIMGSSDFQKTAMQNTDVYLKSQFYDPEIRFVNV
ncbi:MAG TPA: amidohydrolase family protein [Bacteroidia bacterium]